MILSLKIKKPRVFQHPRLYRSKIPNDQSMGAPRVGIMDIMLLTLDISGLFVVMAITRRL